ncbi:MAG: serine O-acetyltransferase [Christensenellales bacterium]
MSLFSSFHFAQLILPYLSIAHAGSIVINNKARVGQNCRIHPGVTIGATNGVNEAAKIGDNCYLGSGAKIIGDIHIADGVAIGANAVVVKSIIENNTTWAGVPARKVSNNASLINMYN